MGERPGPNPEEMGITPDEARIDGEETATSETDSPTEHVDLTQEESELQLADSFRYVEENTVPIIQTVSKELGKDAEKEEVVSNATAAIRELLENSSTFPTNDKLKEIALEKAESRAREFFPIAKILEQKSIKIYQLGEVTHLNPMLAKEMVRKLNFLFAGAGEGHIYMSKLQEIDTETAREIRSSMGKRGKVNKLLRLPGKVLDNLPDEERERVFKAGEGSISYDGYGTDGRPFGK